jgi:hypothetical protein
MTDIAASRPQFDMGVLLGALLLVLSVALAAASAPDRQVQITPDTVHFAQIRMGPPYMIRRLEPRRMDA